MKKYLIGSVIVLACLALILPGCASLIQGLSGFAADPNTSDAVEKGVEGAAGIAGFFGPVGGLIAGVLTGGLAIWRKVKPTLAAAKTETAQANAAGRALTQAIETFKQQNPELWNKLGDQIKDQLSRQGIDPLIVENVIRGLRGLPPLESLPVS